MPRPLRITVPNLFFHILNRGNNRQTVFHCEEDFLFFIQLLKRYKKELQFRLYHFCLMPNHVHFLWCGLYIELNPVRAKLAARPEEWQWSSYRFYAFGENDHLMEGLIDFDPYYLELGNDPLERQQRYREGIEGVREEFLGNIRKALDEGVYGRPEFVREMKEKFKIKSIRSSGRPRKGKLRKEERGKIELTPISVNIGLLP